MKFFILCKNDLLRMLACLFLGVLIGTALTNIVTGRYIDELIIQNNDLTQQLTDEQARVKQFEKVHSWTPIVRKVEVKLTCSTDKHTEQELEKKIKDLLTGLIGLKIQQLDTTILHDILHNRIIPIGDDNFELLLETIIVDDDLVFIVQAKKRSKKALEDE